MISLIVACDAEYGIGKGGTMPWHFPADFAYFKEKTQGHVLIAGRKNFEDMGVLPHRKTIVVTRDHNYCHADPQVYCAHDIFEAVEKAKWLEQNDEICIVGGAQIYELALINNLVDTIYLTQITRKKYDCDTFFQDSLLKPFKEIARTKRYADKKNPEQLDFIIYNKREKGDTELDTKTQ